jgi:predicted nucleic acid-binding Zn ribbon protein
MNRFLEDGKSLKQAMGDMMKKTHMDQKFLELELKDRWEEIVGSLVARHTIEFSIFKDKLTIRLDSAPLKQEINYRKKALLDKINKSMGKIVVSELAIK